MKVEESAILVEKIGFENKEKRFTINANAQAFKLLSSKIYSNPIKAIIRELSANSYDAHVQAKTLHIPFDVHLPNALAPYFKIRDYGTGLSEYDILNLYSTFCLSNKTDSNSYVGQLGIGSKSPFSYTDSYSVVSYFNGEKLNFLAFVAEDGCPSIILLDKEKTSEHNGLEVSFPVKKTDIGSFAREANFVYSLWEPTKPNISGNKIELDVFQPIMQSKPEDSQRWMIGGNISENFAVMGNITYRLDFDNLIYENIEIGTAYNKLLYRNHIVIWFDIGDLDITASREELSYSAKTIRNLKDCLENVLDTIRQRLEDDIKNNAKSYWEACNYYNKTRDLYYTFSLCNLTFNGKELSTNIRLSEPNDWSPKFSGVSVKRVIRNRSKIKLADETGYISLPTDLYVNDLGNRNGINRLKNAYNNSQSLINSIYTVEFENDVAKQAFLNYLEVDESIFNLTSQLPELPKNATATRAKTIQIYKWRGGYWNEEKIDIATATDIFSFIKLHRFEIKDKIKGDIHRNDFSNVITSLMNLGIDLDNIVGVREKIYKKIIDLPNWRPFSEIVKEKYEAFISSEKLEDILPILESNTTSYYQLLEDHWKTLRNEIECEKFQKIFATIELVEKYADNLADLTRIQKFLNGEQDVELKTEFNINDRFDNLVANHYPMLEFVKNWYRYQNSEIDYVKESINYVNYLHEQFKSKQGALC